MLPVVGPWLPGLVLLVAGCKWSLSLPLRNNCTGVIVNYQHLVVAVIVLGMLWSDADGFKLPGSHSCWLQNGRRRPRTQFSLQDRASSNSFFGPTFRNGISKTASVADDSSNCNSTVTSEETIEAYMRDVGTFRKSVLLNDEYQKLVAACRDLIVCDSLAQTSSTAAVSLFRLRHTRICCPRYINLPESITGTDSQGSMDYKKFLLKVKLDNISDACYSRFEKNYPDALNVLGNHLVKLAHGEQEVVAGTTIPERKRARQWFSVCYYQDMIDSANVLQWNLESKLFEVKFLNANPKLKIIASFGYSDSEINFLLPHVHLFIKEGKFVRNEFEFYIRLIADLDHVDQIGLKSLKNYAANNSFPADRFIIEETDSKDCVQYKRSLIRALLAVFLEDTSFVAIKTKELFNVNCVGLLGEVQDYIVRHRDMFDVPANVSQSDKVAADAWVSRL
jgi:hypothetical protein